MLTFVEHKTPNSEVSFLYTKSDAARLIETFVAKVNTQTQRYPLSFRKDQGGEFVNRDLKAYLREKGITQKQSAAYSNECNVVAEPYNQRRSAIVRPALEHTVPSLGADAHN